MRKSFYITAGSLGVCIGLLLALTSLGAASAETSDRAVQDAPSARLVRAVSHRDAAKPAAPDGGPRFCPEATIMIEIQTDNYPGETTWEVTEQGSGTLICSGGPYEMPMEFVVEECCVPFGGCYTFTIFDAFGDGICCDNGLGYYIVTYNGVFVAEGGEFGASEIVDNIGEGCDPGPAPDFTFSAPFVSPMENTCGAGDDCPLLPSEDHIYEVMIPLTGTWDFSLETSTFDGYICVGTSICGSEIGCTDYMGGIDPEISAYIPAGMYYVTVEGYDGGCGDYILTVEEASPCDVEPSPEAMPEGEPTCFDEYEDMYNGGCDSLPPVFQPIACGEVILGTSGTYLRGGSQYRDTDWYEIVLSESTAMTWSVRAEFPVEIQIMDGMGGCGSPTVLGSATANPCETASLVAVLPEGMYWLWVAPTVYDGIMCDVEYEATVTCDPSPGEGCNTCPGDANGDGLRNGEDIAYFLTCYLAGPNVLVDCLCSDVIRDDVFDHQDLMGFVTYLLEYDNSCEQMEPYASTALLELEIYPDAPVIVELGSCEDVVNTTMLLDAAPYMSGDVIDTEIIDMNLVGDSIELGGPVTLRERVDIPSPGHVDNVVAAEDGGFLYGDSFFDVYVEIEMPDGTTLHTDTMPIPITSLGITELPASGSPYTSGLVSVPVYDSSMVHVGEIKLLETTPCEGKRCVFRVDCIAGKCDNCGVSIGQLCSRFNCPNSTCPTGFKNTCGDKDCCVEYVLVACEVTSEPPCPPGAFCPRCEPTVFPVNPTQCPTDYTNCPVTDTVCIVDATRCPVVDTVCPSEVVMTVCPEELTECPLADTACPNDDPTVCEFTVCPVEDTFCPSNDTVCPLLQTFCPRDPTLCPQEPTECPEVATVCPATATVCPEVPVPTLCPVIDTECPEVSTTCPPCQCEISITSCPSSWLPQGREYGTSTGDPGNSVSFTATVTQDAPRKISFFLQEVSSEPGVCMNYGDESGATPDLKFIQTGTVNPAAIFDPPSGDGMTITTKNEVTSATVTVTCYDWGAWGEIRACCHGSGSGCEAYTEWKDIPLDDLPAGGNHIADSWWPSMASNVATWDGDSIPKNMKRDGDGYSFYEEYRGAMLGFIGWHERLFPLMKELFIYDEDLLHLYGHRDHKFIFATGILIKYVNKDPNEMMNGPGLAAGNHRWINDKSEFAKLANQYALHVKKFNLAGRANWGLVDGAILGTPKTADPLVKIDRDQVMDDFRIAVIQQGGSLTFFGELMAWLNVTSREITATMTHEMGHGVSLSHHSQADGGRVSPYGDEFCGEIMCFMRYDFDLVEDDNAAHPDMWGVRTAANSPAGTLPARFEFSNYTNKDLSDVLPVLNVFCTQDNNCRGQIDVKDD